MNEPSNFGTNQQRPMNWPEKDKPYWSLKCPQSKWDDPVYKPSNDNFLAHEYSKGGDSVFFRNKFTFIFILLLSLFALK